MLYCEWHTFELVHAERFVCVTLRHVHVYDYVRFVSTVTARRIHQRDWLIPFVRFPHSEPVATRGRNTIDQICVTDSVYVVSVLFPTLRSLAEVVMREHVRNGIMVMQVVPSLTTAVPAVVVGLSDVTSTCPPPLIDLLVQLFCFWISCK